MVEGPQGERRVPLEEFQRGLMDTCLESAEVLKGVLVPRLSSKARWSYLKFTRKVGEFPHSIAAVICDEKMTNVVLGAVEGKPVRLEKVSRRIEDASDEVVREDIGASTGLDPSSYEFQLHRTMVLRAIAAL